jgi:hypothetical protein
VWLQSLESVQKSRMTMKKLEMFSCDLDLGLGTQLLSGSSRLSVAAEAACCGFSAPEESGAYVRPVVRSAGCCPGRMMGQQAQSG